MLSLFRKFVLVIIEVPQNNFATNITILLIIFTRKLLF